MNSSVASLLLAGLSTIILLITTVTLDRSLFPSLSGYWARFVFLGLRFGVGAFVLWSIYVLIIFR